MTYVLEPAFRSGGYEIFIISQQSVEAHQVGAQGVTLFCRKEPAFVLVRNDRESVTLDMTGAKVPLAQVAALCPSVVVI